MRLIDADALSFEVDRSKHNNPHPQGWARMSHRYEHDHFRRMIYDAPTVDSVEVVRCKDCYFTEESMVAGRVWCNEHAKNMLDNDYCSCGERKDDE